MDEHEAVAETEFIYRRVHANFYDGSMTVPVQFEAFRPSKNDTTGLSVFRARFASARDTLPGDPAKAKSYYVARLAVRDLKRFGLTVQPDPIPAGPPGHCVLPELTAQTYEADKAHWKPVLVELARLASGDIVQCPS